MITNPIIPGFQPDPSILRVGDVYYIANSSFEWFPGIPLQRSYDLKNWELFAHAITRVEQADIKAVDSAAGVWAPSLSYDETSETFYITYSIVKGFNNNNFDVDNYVIMTKDIEGEWSDAIYLNSSGFDPCLFHDVDGRSYIVNLQWEFRQGYEHPGVIIIQEYDKEKQCLVGEVITISNGATDRGCAEGPNLYKHGDYYYLVIAEGGTGFGHCVTISRATKVTGPYEAYDKNPVITSQPKDFSERGIGDSAKPWQYAPGNYLQKSGHGSIVETKNGEPYIAHLCSRPFVPELRSVLGRESAIQKCLWTEDGWLTLDSEDNVAKQYVQEPMDWVEKPVEEVPVMDCFTEPELSKYYYTLREPVKEQWCHISENNTLLVRGRDTLFSKYDQSLVAKKVDHFSYVVETKMKFDPENIMQMAGLVNYYNNQNFYYLRLYHSASLGGKTLAIMSGDKGIRKEYLEDRILLENDVEWVWLRAVVKERELQYYYATEEDNWKKIGSVLDVTTLSDEYAGGFTGTMAGLSVQDLHTKQKCAEFAYFKLENL